MQSTLITRRALALTLTGLSLLGLQRVPAQTPAGTAAQNESILQKRYDAAQHYQAAGQLAEAATQYRIFIADTLGEVALGRAQAGQYDNAADAFDEALRLVPDFPMLQLEYARVALGAGHLEHARVLAKDLLQRYPANAKVAVAAHVVLGRALLKLDQNAAARLEFEAAVALDPSFPNGYELAIADLNLGDIAAARKVFHEMESSFGDTAALHLYFGQAYGNSDFQADAVAELQKALAEDPKLPGAHYALAVAELATAGDSKLAEAEAELRQEIQISPKDAQPYAALGHLIALHGQTPADFAEAERDLQQATNLAPDNPDAYLYLGQLDAAQNKPTEAIAALRRSIELTTDVSRNAYQVQKAHYLLARLLRQSGDKEAADQELQRSQALLQQNLTRDQQRLSDYLQEKQHNDRSTEFHQTMQAVPDDLKPNPQTAAAVAAFEKRVTPAVADSYNNLGAIAASQQQLPLALTCFTHAAEWSPALPGLDFNWGRAAFEAGDYAQAVGPLQRYLRAHPQEDGARRVLGVSQYMQKDYAAARATLQPLATHAEETPRIRFVYADSLLKTGDAADAIAPLEALAKLTPVLPEVQPALAEAYATLGRQQLAAGNTAEASKTLEQALRLDPKNAALQQALQQARQGGPR
jgi:tetratricopeptide (TPR) repeat protein